MTAIDTILRHYEAHEKQHIDIPEWAGPDGAPLRIYWKLMTVEDAEAFTKSDAKLDLDIFVRFALDAAGARMFPDLEHKIKLRKKADNSIISRVARAMIGPAKTIGPMVEAAEKN